MALSKIFPFFHRNGKAKKELSPFRVTIAERRRDKREAFAATAAQKARSNGHRIQYMVAQPGDAKIIRELGSKLVRMYAASLTDNLNSDMPISLTSSNAEILTSLIGVRSRARTLERNNGYAVGMITDKMRNIGGHDPFRLEMQVGKFDAKNKFTSEVETNRKIMDAWEEAGKPENCTTNRVTARREWYWQAIAAMFRDGGILARHRGYLHDAVFPNNKLGYAVEPLEYDRLDQNWQRPKTDKGNTNEIQFGIEVDDYRGPIAYHILSRHPGDTFAFSNTPKYRIKVPADQVIALFEIKTRAEQYTGMSGMASVIRLLHQLEQFDIAHITACLTTCCKTIWIEKEYPSSPEFVGDRQRDEIIQAGEGDLLGTDGGYGGWGSGGEGSRSVNTTPGEINDLEYGQRVKMPDPHFPVEAAPQFKRDLLRCISSGSGVWYNTIANDMESVNFASGRLGEGAARDIAMMYQEHVIDMLVRPHFEVWLKYWMLSDECDLDFSRYEEFKKAAVFNGRRWAYTNPLQDVQADILSIEAGLNSRTRIIGESPRGGNAEEVNREIQADRESDKAHDLDFSAADVTKPTISKGLPGEDKPNPFDALAEGTVPNVETPEGAAAAEGAAKTKGFDVDKLERTIKLLGLSDEEFVKSGQYESSMKFVATIRKLRSANGCHAKDGTK